MRKEERVVRWSGRKRGWLGSGEDEGFLPDLGKKCTAPASWSYREAAGADLT